MNLLFVSQCNKNALKETRRILDQFAERKGMRTWQTPMTDLGQRALRKALQRTARKNTAVACHWVKSNQRTELLWVVGNRAQFNQEGTVPTNRTERNILRAEDEEQWHSLEAIHLFSGVAALFHDLGKACDAFQNMIRGQGHDGKNVFRHEWISLKLFESFVDGDDDEVWLERLASVDAYCVDDWLDSLEIDVPRIHAGFPFKRLPPLAQTVAWLILSHHRIPYVPPSIDGPRNAIRYNDFQSLFNDVHSQWNETFSPEIPHVVEQYWIFSRGLPVGNQAWKSRASRFARRLLRLEKQHPERDWLKDAFVMHMARLTLMLADHNGSSAVSPHTHDGNANFANTIRSTGKFNQELTEHLLLVTREAGFIAYALPDVRRAVSYLARHKRLRQRTSNPRFRWQDKAADLTQSVRDRAHKQGAFFVNMASTGAGKTFANARIMYALADPQQGARFSVALGLRTLTMQTGRAYRERLGLGPDELAIRVGGAANQKLFELYQNASESGGSESAAPLMHDHEHVLYEGDFERNEVLKRLLRHPTARALIDAPVLTCTIDHLMPATESQRGGHQIPAMLRLLTSDLVLDEVDDFGLEDLPAVARLVHWAGLLGSKVMLSSATLSPSIVEALFDAYRAGRSIYQQNVGEIGVRSTIVCAWFDENSVSSSDCSSHEEFAASHLDFVERRAKFLARQPVRRIATIADFSDITLPQDDVTDAFVARLLNEVLTLHDRHGFQDDITGKQVSLGLVRMANIEPLVATARKIFTSPARPDVRVHLCVYHSQHPLIVRSHIEHVLDQTLARSGERNPARSAHIEPLLQSSPHDNHVFIILASPVAEVGRDHDYDWAVVEPSSMRSLIQLAGRVRRHRFDAVEEPNVTVLSHNIRGLRGDDTPNFIRPGFEGKRGDFRLKSADLRDLVKPEELEGLDARPRIVERPCLAPRTSLVDLEHARLRALLFPKSLGEKTSSPLRQRGRRRSTKRQVHSLAASHWWTVPRATLCYHLQRWKPFRWDPIEHAALVFLPDELHDTLKVHEEYDLKRGKLVYQPAEYRVQRLSEECLDSEWVKPWPRTDIHDLLMAFADDEGEWSWEDARRYTRVQLRNREAGWRYHPNLGFFGG